MNRQTSAGLSLHLGKSRTAITSHTAALIHIMNSQDDILAILT